MSTRTITGTVKVQIGSYIRQEWLRNPDDEEVFKCLSFTNLDMSDCGHTVVGEAQVTVTLPDHDTIIGNKVDALRAEKTRTLADAQLKATQIEGQIQSLLAITCEVAA